MAIPDDVAVVCDFDRAKRSGEPSATSIEEGMRQKTCLVCHTAII
jgi:hypothetical protein